MSSGNKQQLEIRDVHSGSSQPLKMTYSLPTCLGIRIQHILGSTDMSKHECLKSGFAHLIRESIRARADCFRDKKHDEYVYETGVLLTQKSKGIDEVRFVLKETDRKVRDSNMEYNFNFSHVSCARPSNEDASICESCNSNIKWIKQKCFQAVKMRESC